ncbi:MAG: PAS domain-containing protein [Bryobacteraceae bacterium]
MVQGMAEGALTLTIDGLILFSNTQFAAILRSSLEDVIGSRIQDLVAPEDCRCSLHAPQRKGCQESRSAIENGRRSARTGVLIRSESGFGWSRASLRHRHGLERAETI